MDTDTELLAAWRAGDDVAGNRLVKRHFTAVYRFFRNKVDGDLDELVQATFTRMTVGADRIEAGAFRGFLFAIARNVLREHYRARAKHRGIIDFESRSVVDLGTSPTGVLARKQSHRLLLAGLRSIPLQEQVALELVYWEGMTGKEVGQVMGVPEGTARTRLRSARLSLEAALARLARSPDALASTRDNLERWITAIRDYIGEPAS
ncbi:MAG: sigma-70 family RNA polymerase sigma factor [Myxococcota bacterium]